MKTFNLLKLSLIVLLIGFQLTNCEAQTTYKNKIQSDRIKLRLLTYGMPNLEKQNSTNVIAHKWGIEFYSVAGCVVTPNLEDSIKKHNNNIETLIAAKYGKNWGDQFNKEVDIEFIKEREAIEIIKKLNYIIKKQSEMKKEGNGLHYNLDPIQNTGKYNIYVQGWGKWKGKDEWVTFYKFIADYKIKSVKLLSDKITID